MTWWTRGGGVWGDEKDVAPPAIRGRLARGLGAQGGDSIDFRNPFRKPFRNPFPKVLDFNGNFGILNFEIERLSE